MNRKQAMKKATSSLRISVVLAMLIAVLIPAGGAGAATTAVAVGNAGFEATVLGDGGFSTSFVTADVWAGANGIFNPTTAQFTAEAPEGSNSAWSGGGTISQTLADTLAAGTRYDLSVQVGDRLDQPVPLFSVELWESGGGAPLASTSSTTTALPDGGFAQADVSYDSLAAGGAIEIRLVSTGGGQVNFDDVQLTATDLEDLGVTKTVDDPSAATGATVVYTITASNNGSLPATGVEVNDLLPAGVTYVSDDGGGAYVSGTGVWTIGGLAAATSATLNITATVDAVSGAVVDNTATISGNEADFNPANDSDTATVTVGTVALAVDDPGFEADVLSDGGFTSGAAAFPASAWTAVGNAGNFNPTVAQWAAEAPEGSNTAYSGGGTVAQTLADTLTAGTRYTLSVQVGDRLDTPFPGYSVELWAGGLLASAVSPTPADGAWDTAVVVYDALAGDTQLGNPLEIRLVGAGLQVNFDDVQLTAVPLEADLSVTKTVDSPTASFGDTVIYTITATNNGPQAATGVVVNDVLPAGVSYVSDDGGGAYVPGTGDWTIGGLAAASSAVLDITASVDVGGTPGTVFDNTATVLGAETDPNPLDNSSTASISTFDVAADLCATTGTASLPGATLPVWGYASGDCAGSPTVAAPGGPTIYADEGNVVAITLHNNLDESTALLIGGQAMIPDLAGVPALGSKTYTFTAGDPGTYLYEAGPVAFDPGSSTQVGAQHQVAMGLYGALIVRPAAAGQAYNDITTAFDDEAVLVLSEIDPALNNSAEPAAFDMRDYQPRYFLINGKAYPDTDAIPTAAGNKVLLRYVNAGNQFHSMAVLGTHQTVVALDASLLQFSRRFVAETFAPGQTADAIVTVPAATVDGSNLAIYDGSLLLHNSNTTGFGGMLTFLEVSGAASGDTGPVTSNVAYASGPGFLTATIDDTATGGSDIAAAEYFVDSVGAPGTGTAMTGTFSSPSVTVSATVGVLPGSHIFYVRGQDTPGNWGPVSSVLVTGADTTGPETRSLTLAPNPSNGTAIVALHGTGDDSATGGSLVVAAEYTIDGSCPMLPADDCAMTVPSPAPTASLQEFIPAAIVNALADGPHEVAVRSQDAAFNWGPWVTIELVVDKTGPLTTSVAASPNPNNGSLPFNPSIQAVRVTAQITDPANGAAPGSNIVAVEGFIDTVGANGTGFVFVPSVGLFDSPSEAAFADIPLLTIGQLSAGTHTIYVHGKDATGNWGATSSVDLVIDKTAPAVSGVTATPNPTSGATLVALLASATDGASAVTGAEYFTGADPGVGNGTAMTVTGTGPYSLSAVVDVSAWADGNHVISVRARDAAGNWSPLADTTLSNIGTIPTIALVAPANGSLVASPVTISGTAVDNVAVDSVRIEVYDRVTTEWWNGTTWQAARTFVPATVGPTGPGVVTDWSYVFSPASGSALPYWTTARAYDDAGNRSTRPTTNFTVVADVQVPTIVLAAPTNGAVFAGPPVTISGTAVDNVAVDSVRIEVYDRVTTQWWNGTTWQAARVFVPAVVGPTGPGVVTDWSYVFSPASGSALPYWTTARAYDAAGNRSTRPTTNFRIN